jgi:hypothetical protein
MRRQQERSHLGDFEMAAARVVARLTGERVVLQDDNTRSGMPDLRIELTDRPPAFVEVVTDIDREYSALVQAVRGHQEIPARELDRAWYVTLDSRAQIRDLAPQLVNRLAHLQRLGIAFDTIRMPSLPDHDELAVRELEQLGVIELASAPAPAGQGKVMLYCEGTGGPTAVDWVGFDEWLTSYLASDPLADVRRKLAASGATERHVFVGASFTTPWAAYHALSDERTTMPPSAPRLPAEITHAWIWAFPIGGCLVWYPDLGWRDPRRHWATE